VVVGNGVRISGPRVSPGEPPRPVVALALGARPLAEWRTDGPSPASCGIWPNLDARPTVERRAMWGRSDARYQGDVTPVAFYPASPWKALMRIARRRPSPRPIAKFLAWAPRAARQPGKTSPAILLGTVVTGARRTGVLAVVNYRATEVIGVPASAFSLRHCHGDCRAGARRNSPVPPGSHGDGGRPFAETAIPGAAG
jgi:hypothetical protein